MKLNKKYISLLLLPVFLLAGCRDDELMSGGMPTDPNAITFAAYSVAAPAQTRGGKPLYDPLVLTGEGSAPLYLHTYETEKIGYRPGEDAPTATRGQQVVSAEELAKFHKNFVVLATAKEDDENYFGWAKTIVSSQADNIWFTERTQYWPGQKELNFYAVSPYSELGNLSGLKAQNGRMSFSYTARKSEEENKDAEAQPDLLMATSTCNKAGSVAGRAPLKFGHALSAVKFAVRDVLDGEVVNIKISGVNSTGNCTFFPIDPEEGIGDFVWSDQSGKQTYSQDFNYKIDDRGIVSTDDDTQDLLLNSTMPEKTFMMIPQEIPDDAKIIVTLKRKGMSPEQITVSGNIKDNLVSEWKPGHEYVYTISTSKDNWVNIFAVGGNHRTNKAEGAHDVTDGDYIYVYSPVYQQGMATDGTALYPHTTYKDFAPVYVRSYRYRANQPSVIETLKWEASHGGTEQYRVRGTSETLEPKRGLTAEEWIISRDALKGNGSFDKIGERKVLEFAPHHQLSTWKGDLTMQDRDTLTSTQKKPYDLSMSDGSRNTANCYVVDRGGWYSFPLVYGNGYKNGSDNSDAYNGSMFVDHKNKSITSPDIPLSYCHHAQVIWSDVHNAISDVSMTTVGGKPSIVFKANKYNMQQGNVVIALFDGSGQISWSWHIWITEHWLDEDTMLSNYQKSDGDFSTLTYSPTNWRDKGDVLINNSEVDGKYGFYMAPYNLGWCDPKAVDYMRRYNDMKFVQYTPEGNPTGKEATLHVLQEGQLMDFRYGNNTYYQWGRKDPMIGFVNHTSIEKRNFEDTAFPKLSSAPQLYKGILNPMTFYYNADGWETGNYGEWSSESYNVNLWNNNGKALTPTPTNIADLKCVKTVYDPCPPGYMVPPAYAFRFIGKHSGIQNGSYLETYEYNGSAISPSDFARFFNGKIVTGDRYVYLACAVDKANMTDKNTIWFTSTGERWDRPQTVINGSSFYPGYNFNSQMVYLWSSSSGTGSIDLIPGRPYGKFNGWSICLGYDEFDNGGVDIRPNGKPRRIGAARTDRTNSIYALCSHFAGRKSMSRPVRPIREN